MTDNNTPLPKAWRPPMGWNSWDSYGTTVTEEEVLDNAQAMAQTLLPAGWDTVVIDAAWYDPTARAHGYNDHAPIVLDAYGRQLPDPARFPSSSGGRGFGPLADRIHSLGLKLGLHVMRGIPKLAVERELPVYGAECTARQIADLEHVCPWNPDNYGIDQSRPGAHAWYDAQVDQFAQWGIDYLKVDDMQMPFYPEEIDAYCAAVEKAERRYGRDIVLSLSPGRWMPTTHIAFLRKRAQLWRIGEDLWDRWDDVQATFARLARWAPLQGTGHWADADMLPLGHIGLRAERGEDRQSRLTADERRTTLTLWAMARSPLMVGGDLPTSDRETLAELANPALLEVTAGSTNNREIIREPGHCFFGGDPDEHGKYVAWVADATDRADGTPTRYPGGHYCAMFWTGAHTHECEIELQSIVGIDGRSGTWSLTDLWGDANARIEGTGADRVVRASIPSHGVSWFVLHRP